MREFIKEKRLVLCRLILSACLVLGAAILACVSAIASVITYLVAYSVCAYPIVISAFMQLVKDKRVGEKMLMTVSSIGAIIVGAYFEAALIVILFEFGEIIEDLAITSSRSSVEGLQQLRPLKARIKGQRELIPVEDISVGEIIEILAGERIPLDGIVTDSAGAVDTSVITGEGTPVDVRHGCEVLAGCLNLNSVIYVRVVRTAEQSAAQRIIDLSVNALDKKTKNEKFIRRFANVYTPVVIILALAVAILPPLFDGFDFATWVYRACSLLAISCPCALVISVPLAYFCGIGYASKKGVLIKSSSVMESLEKIDVIAFDKTGTLTKPDLHVNRVESFDGLSKIDVLRYVCIAEKKSNHPIALAIVKEAKRFNIVVEDGENYEEYPGKGVECDSSYGHIKAGSNTFVDATTGVSAGNVYVSANGKYVGYVGIGDELKENSKIAFTRLNRLGIQKKIILSGDKKSKVDLVAKSLGADGAYSNLLPEDKLYAIEDIYTSIPGCRLAYCGDGINDLPSLARADVGISMGAIGSDAAVDKSDVVIMDDNVDKIPLAIRIARKVKRVVLENIIFSIAAKASLLVLGAIGLIPLYVAVLGDVGLLILAILNSIRSGR